MTIRNPKKFDPEALLAAPSRSAGIPNADATKIIYTVSSYSFKNHEKTASIFVLDTESSESTLVEDSKSCSNPAWLDGDNIALLKSKDDKSTEVLVGNVKDFQKDAYVAGTIDSSVDNLKVTRLGEEVYGIAVTAAANPDGSIYNPNKAKKPHSTGRLYRSLYARHWDAWVTPQKNAIWYGQLSKSKKGDDLDQCKQSSHYSLSPLVNALKGTALESPISPLGGKDHFDISKRGIIFVAKDPELPPAVNTKCNLYLVPLGDFSEPKPTVYQTLAPEEFQGAMTSPVFSADGSKAAVLAMKQNEYESDRNEILFMPNTMNLLQVDHVQLHKRWDYSPTAIAWYADSNVLLLLAEDRGNNKLFTTTVGSPCSPRVLDGFEGSISDMHVLAPRSPDSAIWVFVSGSSMVDNSRYAIIIDNSHVTSEDTPAQIWTSSWSRQGANLGLHASQISEIWSPSSAHEEGVSDQPKHIHSWVVRPKNFDKSKKYPLALLVHGGPQGAWLNSWSTRWNPAVFAEQGYVVVCPNPTGSTGFGQKFTDAIAENWGNWPYKDLVNCVKYIEKNMDYVDMDRAVALGASYGGYMMNWIQGQELGRKFKALVTHDGNFNTAFQIATDELYFLDHDLGGPWSQNREKWQKWSPSRFTENWQTPHLIIHSEKDYRLCIAEAMAAFNVLQTQGVESEFLSFPDENHWVLNPENSLMWHATVFNFINRHVGLPLYREDEQKEIIQDPPRPPKSLDGAVKKASELV